MLTRDGFRACPTLYRRPIVFPTIPMLPRPPQPCAECGAPLPLLRSANMVACPGACIEARRKRTAKRANARRKIKKLKERAERAAH